MFGLKINFWNSLAWHLWFWWLEIHGAHVFTNGNYLRKKRTRQVWSISVIEVKAVEWLARIDRFRFSLYVSTTLDPVVVVVAAGRRGPSQKFFPIEENSFTDRPTSGCLIDD